MLQLAKALEELHAKDIMHRDIKLDNIMLRDDEPEPKNPVLVDFGLARRGPVVGKSVCGTPGYIAPEIFVGGYTNKCDVFGLGVVYHYL
jgi:serine/threonine protein kinase